jgi:hypothetical protein
MDFAGGRDDDAWLSRPAVAAVDIPDDKYLAGVTNARWISVAAVKDSWSSSHKQAAPCHHTLPHVSCVRTRQASPRP